MSCLWNRICNCRCRLTECTYLSFLRCSVIHVDMSIIEIKHIVLIQADTNSLSLSWRRRPWYVGSWVRFFRRSVDLNVSAGSLFQRNIHNRCPLRDWLEAIHDEMHCKVENIDRLPVTTCNPSIRRHVHILYRVNDIPKLV